MDQIKEGKAKIRVKVAKIVSREMPVFYNPEMRMNRDLSILLLNALGRKGMQIGLPLEGSGIRGIRMLLEVRPGIIKSLVMNDLSPVAVKSMRSNLRENRVKCRVANLGSDEFLLDSKGFDYIDIDPFGSPNRFLDIAIKRISRGGILAVTATDTAPLSGTYPEVCMRKYWAKPMRNGQMHEVGLRILIRKVQLVGAQYEKALSPVFSYYQGHYFRAFFSCEKSKPGTDLIMKRHEEFNFCRSCLAFSVGGLQTCCGKEMEQCGPLYTGDLSDKKLVKRMREINKEALNDGFLGIILGESGLPPGLFFMPEIGRVYKMSIPRKEMILKNKAIFETHFSPEAFKGRIGVNDLVAFLEGLGAKTSSQ